MNVPVFDLHCDTALALLGENLRSCGSLKHNSGHIDLERAGLLDGYAQCFACFTSDAYADIPAVDLFERELATIHRELEKNSSIIRQAYSASDIQQNLNDGIMSAILTVEGPAGFGYDPELLQDLYLVGFRMTTLGWNDSNPLTGSSKTGGGLTDLGRAYVKEAQRLGMLVDVSHISDEGFWDIMDITQAPVIASHSNSRAVYNTDRNITDDMFCAICKTGGVVGINLYASFLGNNASLDTVCDHILHFLELDPAGKHISLGGDLDGCEYLPKEFDGIQSYPSLASHLLKRGVDLSTVRDIFWNNAIGVITKCCM